ncbi:hypothetical protein HRbin06_00666 [archaeon HR06]|nr:hypothetical protein HRbin06_00666 [archaeon HR06]
MASTVPPVFLTILFTYIPSPGSPIAMLVAIVLGFSTGIIKSLFSLKA